MLVLATVLNYTVAYSQSALASWYVGGNANVNAPVGFLGTTDANKLVIKVNNFHSGLIDYHVDTANTSLGYKTLISLTTGAYNVALGYLALYSNTTGGGNTGTGIQALYNNVSGWNNTAAGAYSLANSSSGNDNTAYGSASLVSNTSGSYNTATGFRSLYLNTSGNSSTAMGYRALYNNTASGSTGFGYQALYSNTSGTNNTATGYNALYSNTTGNYNAANGNLALYSNTTGESNSAFGSNSLQYNTTANLNSAFGFEALQYNTTGIANSAFAVGALLLNTTGGHNNALGYGALSNNTTGNYNTALGSGADISYAATFSNATAIGALAIVNASNKVRIGDANVTVIEGQPATYSSSSDGRFKTNIEEKDVKGLAFIKLLRPVVYNFDTRKFEEFLTKGMPEDVRQEQLGRDFTASTNIRHSGFIAQEVEKAAQEIGYDFDAIHKPASENDNYSLSYSQFVVPLVKAVQELSADNDKKGNAIVELNKKVDDLQSQLNALLKELGKTPKQDQEVAKEAYLEQNSPNPFNVDTRICYNIPASATNAVLTINNTNGLVMKTISLQNKGNGQVNIAARELTPGIYFYSLSIDGKKIDTKEMVITR